MSKDLLPGQQGAADPEGFKRLALRARPQGMHLALRAPPQGMHNNAWAADGGAAAAQRGGRTQVVVGMMVAAKVDARLIEAHHWSVFAFNARQSSVHVSLRFFVGRQGHPMVGEGLAEEVDAATNRLMTPGGAPTPFPLFVRGHFVENLNSGKTNEWFEYAVGAFPNSHFIFKMDVDVIPKWHLVGQLLEAAGGTQARRVYLGRLNTHDKCGGLPRCPPPGCTDMSRGCWVYMSGGFYGVSGDLAALMAGCAMYRGNVTGPEDLNFGKLLRDCSHRPEEITVVAVKPGTAWCHTKKVNTTNIRRAEFPGLPGMCTR